MPSIIAPFCLAAISRRSARSSTARLDFSPVSARARSINCGSRSTLVNAMMRSSGSLYERLYNDVTLPALRPLVE